VCATRAVVPGGAPAKRTRPDRCHQDEDQQGDDWGSQGACRHWADEEAAMKGENACRAGESEGSGEARSECGQRAGGEMPRRGRRQVVSVTRRRASEAPEDEGMRREGAGRMTFTWATSQTKSRMRGRWARGGRRRRASSEILLRMTRKRRQKMAAEAVVSAMRSSFSARRVLRLGEVAESSVIGEPPQIQDGRGMSLSDPRFRKRDQRRQIPLSFSSGRFWVSRCLLVALARVHH